MISLYPVLAMFFAPVMTFRSLASQPRYGWVPPFLVCGLCSIVMTWGTAPIMRALFVNHLPSDVGQARISDMLISMQQQQQIDLVTAPLDLLVRWLVHAGCLWLLIQLMNTPIRFSTTLMVVGYACTVVSLGDLLNLLTLHWHGVDQARDPLALLGAFGLDRVAPGTQGPGMESLLRRVNVFSLWHLTLLITGLSIAGGLERKKAVAVSLVTWLVPLSLTVWPLVLPFEFLSRMSLFFGVYPAVFTTDLDVIMVLQNLSR